MQLTAKFINCEPYDFKDSNGNRVQGISCKCFDVVSNKIIKVKTEKMLPYNFGDDVTVDVVFNGRYVNYQIA